MKKKSSIRELNLKEMKAVSGGVGIKFIKNKHGVNIQLYPTKHVVKG
ncbi:MULTISPECIES: hypothetical protein [unclassified Brenneria]|nr:hypothetical protein [Brenneria sp. hezel4-2-4]MEE3650326.1 hypothetical protein [Brenneria sp. HEZEL_4_2_4]NPD00282.1 hypothetical protein [Brenneria sp. hezel4-2-4]